MPETKTLRLSVIVVLASLVIPLFAPFAAAALPASAGAPGLPAQRGASVGTFDVTPVQGHDGEGKAQGGLVSGILSENGGSNGGSLIRDFSVAAPDANGAAGLATKVFSSVDVKGFQPTSKLQGVGTSALSMKGDGLVLSLVDNVNSLLIIKATKEQQVSFITPDDIIMQKDAALDNVFDVSGSGSNAIRGALVLVGSAGQASGAQGSSLALADAHKLNAVVKVGTELIFRADTAYSQGASGAVDQKVGTYNDAVIAAIAHGKLAGEATTDFSQGANLIANINYFASAQARTDASAAHRVTTTLKDQAEAQASAVADACASATGAGNAAGSAPGASGSAAGSASANACAHMDLLAYDLDYVDVPAQTADNVAVYIDGALAQKVEAAADVVTHADAYWATTVDGRVLVLANVAAQAQTATQITIAAVASANAAASTLAQLDAEGSLTSQVQGSFEMLGSLSSSAQGSGQVIGTFSTFFANEAKGDAAVHDVTDIRSSTEIFTKIEFAADAAADATATFTSSAKASAAGYAQASASGAASAAVEMTTSVSGQTRVVAEFTDSVYSTIEAQAEAATEADFHLSNDVSAHALAGSDQIVQLDGPAGKVGYLIVTKAEGGMESTSQLDLSQAQHVKAHLLAGEEIVFRGASEAQSKASAEIAARAIASGALASEATVGFVANAIASANVDYRSHIHTTVAKSAELTHRGQVTLDYAADAAASAKASVVSLIADRATLAAQSAADIAVTVDGKAAQSVDTAAAVIGAAETGATSAEYTVTTSLNGQAQVLIAVPGVAAGAVSKIVVESKLEAQSRMNAALDIFGSFKPAYGGAANGDIVSLVAKQDAGLILDYTVAARNEASASEGAVTKVFDAVKMGGSAFAAASSASSSSIKFENEQGTLEAFDVSGAVMKVIAKASSATDFDLASNLQAQQVNPNVVMISGPDFSGALILVQGAAAQGSTLVASQADGGKVEASLNAGAEVIVKAFSGFEADLSSAEKQAQANAISAGTLLGQVIVHTDAATHATTTTAVNYYSSVNANTAVATANEVQVLIDSATHSGKSIIISLDRETVKGLIDGDGKLLVDGQEVSQAKSYSDALTPNADKYWLITTDGKVGLQAIVTLSHFSTRTITVQGHTGINVFLWTTVALGGIVLVQAVYPRLRPQRK